VIGLRQAGMTYKSPSTNIFCSLRGLGQDLRW